jgi:lysophospholipid acyltransferase (LPLAT)-like uncharacterized protein
VIPHSPTWYQRLAGWLVVALIKMVAATMRMRWDDRSGYLQSNPPRLAIFCVWHNRLALCIPAYQRFARKKIPTRGMAAMASASKDGAFLAGMLEAFGVKPARGSSSRRGSQALLELVSWAERGYDLAITPDGPRGPRYQVQEGAMALAQVTGLPAIPCSYHIQWKICLKSWDRFQIPLPFSKCEVVLEKPVFVPREATDADREQLRQQFEATMRSITRD